MSLITVSRKELKNLKAVDFKEGDMVDVLDKNGEVVYTINISFGEYKRPLKTTVNDKNYNMLNCTAGTKGGWPYYIADFIHG
jgi:hypothetical protein